MITRDEVVTEWLTDRYLIAEAKKDESLLAYSRMMLSVPPEYRQGVEARVTQLSNRIVETPHGRMVEILMDSWDARVQALQELRAQGVELVTPSI